MFGNGSIVVLVSVVLGTLATLGIIRMIGLYADATHEYTLARPAAKPSFRSGPDPLLLITILSAAAAAELDVEEVRIREIHEVSVPTSSHDWGAHGRQMIFQSHRLRS